MSPSSLIKSILSAYYLTKLSSSIQRKQVILEHTFIIGEESNLVSVKF